jgi:K+-sensing histidine kinase KdpD
MPQLRKNAGPTADRVQPSLESRYHWATSRLQSASIGAGCCAIAAAGLSPVIRETPVTSFTPIIFLVVIFVVAARIGNCAGMIGTVTAALIFAEFLFEPFEPRFSMTINDRSSRNHLIWMVVSGHFRSAGRVFCRQEEREEALVI